VAEQPDEEANPGQLGYFEADQRSGFRHELPSIFISGDLGGL
jgi:hypothetical protein